MTHDANGPATRNGPADRRSFCDYLREGRAASSMSLEEISRVTRIPQRSLERLEEGAFEALPADVFVRGFLRSYAQCVGLDAEETVRRYAACGLVPAPVVHPHGRRNRAETRNPERDVEPALLRVEHTPAPEVIAPEPEPTAAVDSEPVEVVASESVTATESTDEPKRATKSTRKGKRRGKRKRKGARAAVAKVPKVDLSATGEVSDSVAIAVDEPEATEPVVEATEPTVEATDVAEAVAEPPVSRVVKPPRPVQLVIDDSDPDSAEEIQAERADAELAEREASRRSFLPPALLDTEDGSRRGALTLAVIILVIVATLTMSYLLRHPSSSGSGVTQLGTSEPPSLQA